jgi:hypothetical protein
MGKGVRDPANPARRLHQRRQLLVGDLGSSLDLEPLVSELAPGPDPPHSHLQAG